MYDIFVSYAHEDRKRVARLVNVLAEKRGWSIWFDDALRAGDEFPHTIQQLLEHVRCVLVVWSGRAVTSRWVIAEASEGWDRSILVPLRLDDVDPPLPFRQTEATDFSDWKGSSSAASVLKLVEAIERILQAASHPDESELIAREARIRAARRRKLVRRTGAGAAAAALLLTSWFGWRQVKYRAAADRLADRAAELQLEVKQLTDAERGRTWGSVLLGSSERLNKLELATLIAAEAVRRAATARTESVLQDLLAMSPWSDRGIKVENRVYSLHFSADSELLVAGGGQDGTLVWNLISNSVTRIPHGGMDGEFIVDRRGKRYGRDPSTVDIEPSGVRVATAGPDQTAAVWNARSGQELLRLPHESVVTALKFVPTTEMLATVSENGIVRLWNLTSGKELRRMELGGTSYWIAVSDSGRYLVSSSGDTATVWNTTTGAQLAKLKHTGRIDGARFSVDEEQLVTFGDHIDTMIWQLPRGELRDRLSILAAGPAGAMFSPDGRALIIGSTDGSLRWWNLDKHTAEFSESVGQYVLELASTFKHERLATAGTPEEIASAWDSTTGLRLREMPYPMWLTAVGISPDGRLMASSGFDGSGFVVEITEVRPIDAVRTACRKVKRNLTRNEWREYMGQADAYRATCPDFSIEQG